MELLGPPLVVRRRGGGSKERWTVDSRKRTARTKTKLQTAEAKLGRSSKHQISVTSPKQFELGPWDFPGTWSLELFYVHSKFAGVADAELESARVAIVFVVSNRNAVIETQWPDRKVKAQTQTPVVIKMIQMAIIIRTTLDVANIIERREANAHTALFVLLKDRNAVFSIAEPVGVTADGFVETPLTRADAAIFKAAQCVQPAQT